MGALTVIETPPTPSRKQPAPMKKPLPTGPRRTRNPPQPQVTKKPAPKSAPMKGY